MWSLLSRAFGRSPSSSVSRLAPSPPPSDLGGGSPVLLQHYRDQLAQERSAKEALERRGLGIVATNAAIVSLLFAFGEITTDASTPIGVVVAVVTFAAMGLFAISARFGLLVNRPGEYAGSSVRAMIALATHAQSWARRDKTEAERVVALDIAKLIDKDRLANNAKGERLRTAVRLQVAGLVALALAVVINGFAPS